jgi:8-oxo-dGTP diphosphatase
VALDLQAAERCRHIEVVAALIWRAETLLVQQRPLGVSQALAWEFPGGKIEAQEAPEEALLRECHEELGVQVSVGPLAWEVTHAYPEKHIRLRLYHATVEAEANVVCRQAKCLAWQQTKDLQSEAFCAADIPIVEALRRGELQAP